MFTAPSQIEETARSSRNSLPQKVGRNAIGVKWYRADYELRALRRVKRASNKVFAALMADVTVTELCALSRELDRWMERERILLRISLPREVAMRDATGPLLEAAATHPATPPPADPPPA